MTIISKAALAAELGISKARVSQYVKRGLPVRSDGKIDREPAMNWIAEKNYPLNSAKDVGATKAKRLTNEAAAEQKATAIAEQDLVFEALADVVAPAVGDVAEAAIKVGVSPRDAYAISSLVIHGLCERAERFLQRAAPRRYGRGFFFVEAIDDRIQDAEPDWAQTARDHGQVFDEEAWHSPVDEIMDARREAD